MGKLDVSSMPAAVTSERAANSMRVQPGCSDVTSACRLNGRTWIMPPRGLSISAISANASASTLDERLDLAFGLSLLVAAVAIGGLLAYGYRQWARSTGVQRDRAPVADERPWWFEYMSNVINASHPLWTWLKATCGVDCAYDLLDWAFPATTVAILAFVMSGTRYAIASHRRSLA
ncbi:hypothetical protein OKW41_001801 [Paraburkholderia sp. UCT70]|uniref:hypothetical protein n=1 Tax=Paraburkholderia sp. UCT70 TaxID=2991068 RepID=UPI003D1CFAEA